MSTEETKAIAQRVMERLDQRDLDGVLALCADDAVWYGFAPQPLDKQGYRQAISAFLTAYPDSRFPVDQWIVEADKAVARHSLRGTHKAEFQGIPPTGKQVKVNGIAIFRIADGKVVETWLNADILGMLQQLGVVPTPGQAEQAAST
jgi:steroid delta-isomerase-like uncharacterized protein